MKFDVVLGNPPYQKDNYPLWKDFGALAIALAPVVAFVTPRSVLNGAADDDARPLQSNFYERIRYHLQLVDYSADNHFDVTKRICAWIYRADYDGLTTLIDDDKNVYTTDARSSAFMLYELTPTALKVYERIVNTPRRMSGWCLATSTTKPSAPAVVLPKSKHISLSKMRWTANVAADPAIDAAWIIMYPTDQPLVEKYVQTRFFKYMFNILGGLDGNTYSLLRKMPELDFATEWTDQRLYRHFDLDQRDIAVIETATRAGQKKKKSNV